MSTPGLNQEDEKRIREFIGQKVGEASTCWSPLPEGVFDSTRASGVADQFYSLFEENVGLLKENLEKAIAELKVARERLGPAGYRIIQELTHAQGVVWAAQELMRNYEKCPQYPENVTIKPMYLNHLRERLYKLDAYKKET